MALNKHDAETVAYILTKKGKHRETQPFYGELINYLTKEHDGKPYYFLSDGDYRVNHLVPTASKAHPYKLTVDSQNQKILERVNEVNEELLKISFA